MKHRLPALLFATLAALSLGATSAAIAETGTPPPGEHRAGHRGPPSADAMTEHMQRSLGLSDEQTQRLRAINQRHLDGMRNLRTEHEAELKTVLSEEQYEKLRDEHRQKRERHRGDRAAEPTAPE